MINHARPEFGTHRSLTIIFTAVALDAVGIHAGPGRVPPVAPARRLLHGLTRGALAAAPLAAACGTAFCGAAGPGALGVVPAGAIAPDLRPYATGLHEMGPERAGAVVIRDAATWAAFMTSVLRDISPRPPVPAVDFGREMVVGYALGRRFPMSGPVPAVRGAWRRGDTLRVAVRVAGACPVPDDGSAAPVAVARVPRHAGPVRLVVDSLPCTPP